MALRDEIANIRADAQGDKGGRIDRLKASHLHDRVAEGLPLVWQPRAGTTIRVKAVHVRDNVVSLVADITRGGVTKSLSEWLEGAHSTPDLRIVNPPLFVDDPAGDVVIEAVNAKGETEARRGREDMLLAMKQTVRDVVENALAARARR